MKKVVTNTGNSQRTYQEETEEEAMKDLQFFHRTIKNAKDCSRSDSHYHCCFVVNFELHWMTIIFADVFQCEYVLPNRRMK